MITGVIVVPAAVYVIWVAMLVIAVLLLPLIVWLLNRVLTAARDIKGYTATTLEAGTGIAGHTSHVPALQETIQTATQILETAASIEQRTAVIQSVLLQRAGPVHTAGRKEN